MVDRTPHTRGKRQLVMRSGAHAWRQGAQRAQGGAHPLDAGP